MITMFDNLRLEKKGTSNLLVFAFSEVEFTTWIGIEPCGIEKQHSVIEKKLE